MARLRDNWRVLFGGKTYEVDDIAGAYELYEKFGKVFVTIEHRTPDYAAGNQVMIVNTGTVSRRVSKTTGNINYRTHWKTTEVVDPIETDYLDETAAE